MDTQPWWSTFFDGAALELWRQAIPHEVTEREVELLWDLLALAPGSRVLDVPCGNGRHALEFAARGAAVSGFDISAEFVEEARARARRDDLSATFEQRDMRGIDAVAAFDAVLCINTAHNVPPEDCRRSLREIMRVARRHAFVQVDAWTNERERENLLNWYLTAETLQSREQWLEMFREEGYDGDCWWTIFP